MANSRGTTTRRRLMVVALTSFALADVGYAAPGFIESSSVNKGNIYSEISIRFRCKSQLLGHDPSGKTDVVRISIQPTTVCVGAPPTIALSRELLRPPGAEYFDLESIEYDGQLQGQETLRLVFEEEVTVDVRQAAGGDGVVVRVFSAPEQAEPPATVAGGGSESRRVDRDTLSGPRYVINLESSQQEPVAAVSATIDPGPDKELFVSEIEVDGQTWYRLRVGYFPSADVAARELSKFRKAYPDAWIDQARESESMSTVTAATGPAAAGADEDAAAPVGIDNTETSELMKEARHAMTAGELSRAIQLYTKVLRQPATAFHPDAQEYLALARERNGQLAHAKAEYEAYLEAYPDSDGADRVRQRLAALLSGPVVAAASENGSPDDRPQAGSSPKKAGSEWKLSTYLSQYYRRDVNQMNDENEIVSQSSIYTDGSIDARKRGERFDIAARLTGGYRTDLLSEEDGGQGNDFRLSYAYVDVMDATTRIGGRLGRQTRNSGGVLGRFDGLNVSYDLTERVELQAVAGVPVYSTTRDDVVDRSFYGISATYGPVLDNLDVTAFYLQQDVEGLTDRQAIGGEMRYFAQNQTIWAMVDYDIEFSEISSAFLQTSWRLPGNLSLTGLFDHRRSPYLSLGNALIGQPDQDFDALMASWTEEEIRRLALERSAAVSTITLGVNRPLTPKLQLGLNATRSSVEETAESAGVAAIPSSEYSYYSLDVVASSLLREGDVAIFNLRQSSSATTDILSINVDARFPFGRKLRFGPRMRIDRREIQADGSEEWIYSPGLRLQYRPARSMRLELTAGKEFSTRDMVQADLDRESYFIYLGYQWFK
jgi:tetratricopeptide (TPR) repeat protein